MGAASGVAVLGAATPASAAPHLASPPIVQFGYTDARHPWTAYDGVDQPEVPLGSWLDDAGDTHTARLYVTFDLSQFVGTTVSGGTIWLQERRVADCTKRSVEVWQTRTVRRTPSWRTAPRELRKLDEATTGAFCPALLTFDVGSAVTEAVAQNKKRITFAFRVSEQFETDPSYGRHLNRSYGARFNVEYNTTPRLDEESLRHGGFPCVEGEPLRAFGGWAGHLQAYGSDADDWDNVGLRYDFAVWPVDDPAARTEFSSNGSRDRYATGRVPAALQEDGKTYAWQVRVSDGIGTSPWSRTCQYLVDRTPPPAPTVSSSNYPRQASGEWTPVGEPGHFTFFGGGDEAVLGFHYAWYNSGVTGCNVGDGGRLECQDPFYWPGRVRADVPGGTASVNLNPEHSGPVTLYVRSIDKAGNASDWVEYAMLVRHSQPTVSVIGGPPVWGEQLTLKFSPPDGVTGTTEYTYQINRGESQTVAAAADGSATVSFLATREDGYQVDVRSRSLNGFISQQASWGVYFDPWPGVTADIYRGWEPVGGVGVPGTFTFSPPPGQAFTQLAGYRYTFDGEDQVFVSAGTDLRATITWTPQASGYRYLFVVAVATDGTVSPEGFYDFTVA
jgi:hypothetical protein